MNVKLFMSKIQKYVMGNRTESRFSDIQSKALSLGEKITMLVNEAAG